MIRHMMLALAERAWHTSTWEENYSTDVENKELEKLPYIKYTIYYHYLLEIKFDKYQLSIKLFT